MSLTKMSAGNAPECINLCGDDPDDEPILLESSSSASSGSGLSAFAAAPPAAAASSQNGVIVIDVVAEDDDDLQRGIANSLGVPYKKKRKKRHLPDPAFAKREAIDIDAKPTAKTDSPLTVATMEYRKIIGPHRFGFLDGFARPNHSFANKQRTSQQARDRKNYQRELIEYQLNLPIDLSSSIFVRACEKRIDLLRALITGPEDTPYANGCFLFDIFAHDYPKQAPKVKFLTTGGGRVRFVS